MELNIETLTQEQRKQLDMWYKIYLNENNKLVTEEPISVTPEFIEYKTGIINKEFQNSINLFTSDYSQAEIDSWTRKVEEAKKVMNLEASTFIEWLIIEWETVDWLATTILEKAELFSVAYANAEKIKRQAIKNLTI